MIDMGFEPEVKKILEYLPGVFCMITVLCVQRHFVVHGDTSKPGSWIGSLPQVWAVPTSFRRALFL